MTSGSARALLIGTLAAVALLQPSAPALADPAIWANAKWVRATFTDCGNLRYLVLRGNSVNPPTPPASPGCTATEETYHQLFVAKALFRADNKGLIAEANVDAGYIFCGKGEVAMTLGSAGDVARAIRQSPAPRGCTYTRMKFQQVSSLGNIAFSNVANGGTMTIAESLAIHAKERERVIAECNASAACRAEVRRLSAINAFNECMKPSEFARTCYRPR
jgi:hypothetical protein